jgi:hypothetical protein
MPQLRILAQTPGGGARYVSVSYHRFSRFDDFIKVLRGVARILAVMAKDHLRYLSPAQVVTSLSEFFGAFSEELTRRIEDSRVEEETDESSDELVDDEPEAEDSPPTPGAAAPFVPDFLSRILYMYPAIEEPNDEMGEDSDPESLL